MSYRELRNFCEIMRGLGYPRLISIENFRNPNFELVADILYWLAQRFDPSAEISDEIEDERNRIEFIKQVATLFLTKTRIKLNTQKLYGSDGEAVQEILKVASILYKAYNSTPSDEDITHGFQLPAKLQNLKQHKQVANSITEIGVKLSESLTKEKDLKTHREKALQFLDNVNNLENDSEQQYIEKCVREIISQQDQSIDDMQKYVTGLERDQRVLDENIKKKNIDLEKSTKRLSLMTSMRPAYLDEYERLETELEKLYEVYIERFRNLNYLEGELTKYNKIEEKKLTQLKELINQQKRRNDKEIIDRFRKPDEFERGQSRGDSRTINRQKKMDDDDPDLRGDNMDDDDDEDDDDDDNNGSQQDLDDDDQDNQSDEQF